MVVDLMAVASLSLQAKPFLRSDSKSVGRTGMDRAIDLLKFLKCHGAWFRTLSAYDVSSDADFQRLGIDLIWFVRAATCTSAVTVEVKTDRHHKDGNFFFETIRDVERNVEGTFLSSTAEWLFYVFPEIDTVYCIPLLDAREWFLTHSGECIKKTVSGVRHDRTLQATGRLVPCSRLLQEVPGVRRFVKQDEEWLGEGAVKL